MADSIITISDKTKFEELFRKYFNGKEVFIKTRSGNVKINFIGYTDGQAAFLIPGVKQITDQILILTRFDGQTIYSNLKFIENHEDTFIFQPLRFQIIAEARRESRISTGSFDQAGTNVISVTNLVTDFGIRTDLSNSERKLNPIREMIANQLKKVFKYVNIFLISDAKNDNRMNYLISSNENIFIPNIKGQSGDVDSDTYGAYINNIYSKDQVLSSKVDVVSEIDVMVKYTGVIPYGYIQVNCAKQVTRDVLNHVAKMAIAMNELIMKNNVISCVTERFLVSDLSKSGLGIVFKDRKSTRYFRQRSAVSFQLSLPDGNKINVGTIVRNVNYLENGIIKIGLEIKKIDTAGESIYNEYVNNLGSG